MTEADQVNRWEREWFASQDRGLYKPINFFNQNFVSATALTHRDMRVLDIGGGNGIHRPYELCASRNYYLLDMNEIALEEARERLNKNAFSDYHKVNIIKHDVRKGLPFDDNFFDKVVSVNSLEHIPNLGSLFREVSRVLKDDGGFCSVFPCEGGRLFKLGQWLFVAEKFRKATNGLNYFDYIKSEHVNGCHDIIKKLGEHFKIRHIVYFPLLVPLVDLNVSVGVATVKK